MAITTLDGIIAGMQPPVEILKTGLNASQIRFYSSFIRGTGLPTAGSPPAAGLSGVALSSPVTGQISFTNPVSGNTYLARWEICANAQTIGSFYLCDRLWHNSGFTVTSTSVQTVNSVQFPSRDATGGTSGHCVMIGLEVVNNMGAGAVDISLNYTGNNGLTATTIFTAASAMNYGSFIPVPLASGHTGVQKVNWLQQSATMTSGEYILIAYRTIAEITAPFGNQTYCYDAIQLGLPRLYNNSVPFIIYKSAGSAGGAAGFSSKILFTQG